MKKKTHKENIYSTTLKNPVILTSIVFLVNK